MTNTRLFLAICCICICVCTIVPIKAWTITSERKTGSLCLNYRPERKRSVALFAEPPERETIPLSYKDTSSQSKGLVSGLTDLVNFFSGDGTDKAAIDRAGKSTYENVCVCVCVCTNDSQPRILRSIQQPVSSICFVSFVFLISLTYIWPFSLVRCRIDPTSGQAPQTANELLDRIRRDYTDKNYLWTGDVDLGCFDQDCTFTDPTLSFQGRDKFVSNVQNLQPIVDGLIEPGGCRSDLLDINLVSFDSNDGSDQYVESRWNMVGELNRLPWRPKIDVIGRTKFWFRKTTDGLRVYFYDECWEIPAGKALLQLITPAGTIQNQP